MAAATREGRDSEHVGSEALALTDSHGASWACADDEGTSSSSTVALVPARPKHGLLVAACPSTSERCVFLSTIEFTLATAAGTIALLPLRAGQHALAAHFVRFARDPLPSWIFHGAGWEVRFSLGLVPRKHALVMRCDRRGDGRATMEIRPLLAMRAVSATKREHGGAVNFVKMRHEEVHVKPEPLLPALAFRFSGRFVGSPEWRHHDPEDLWTPGTFRASANPGAPTLVACGVETLPDEPLEALWQRAREGGVSTRPGITSIRPRAEEPEALMCSAGKPKDVRNGR